MAEVEINEVERVILKYPSVTESKKPHIGMSFTSTEEGVNFYKEYAKLSGFTSRKYSTKYRRNTRDDTRELYSRECVCSKQGRKDASNEVNPTRQDKGKKKRNRLSIRTGCPAIIRFQMVESASDWKVVKLDEGHNHLLHSPGKAHLMKHHRKVTDVQKNLLSQFSQANISTAQLFSVLGLESGGMEYIGCTERDLRNYVASLKKEKKDFDAQLLVEYLQEMKEMNPSFYYAIDVDDEKKLKHCFWTDGSARKAFAKFGDVVVFDTTYETNQYHMIFAPFTGINHHRQSIGFGWGLLKDEKIESFVWLFEKFMDAMSGQSPGTIITDQDPAMKNAIASSFPTTLHRLCMWHILQKLPDKVRPHGHNPDFCDRLMKCAYYSESPEQFENVWDRIISDFQLEGNKWLLDIFNIRERWIPVYFKNVFMAGARSTTQRSESLNSFFDKYVSKRNTLTEFIVRFKMAIKRQRYNEAKANFENLNGRPKMKTPGTDIEKQMAENYTHAIFYMFQKELSESTHYGAGFHDKDGDLHTYDVKQIGQAESTVARKVVYEKSTKMFSCDCMKFESEGIPCKHILTTLRSVFLSELPDKLILKRWTKKATDGIVHDKNGVELQHDPRDPQIQTGKEELSAMVGGFVQKASMSQKRIEVAKEMVLEMMSKFNLKCEELGEHFCDDTNVEGSATLPMQIDVHPPELSKTKGCGRCLKGWKERLEESKKAKRLCRGCNKKANHDKRNCPNLKSGAASSTTHIFDEDDPSCDDDYTTTVEDGMNLDEEMNLDEINLTNPFLASSLSQL